jgi:DNA-binding transcriptional MerR regulator
MLQLGLPCNQILIEEHQRFYKDGDVRLRRMSRHLRRAGFTLVRDAQEMTFIRFGSAV